MLKLRTAHEKLSSEARFLAKKYIAFLIHKSWARARQFHAREELQQYLEKMAAQRELLSKTEDRVQELLALKDETEKQMANLTEALEQRTAELTQNQETAKIRDESIEKLKEQLAAFSEKLGVATPKAVDASTQVSESDLIDLAAKFKAKSQ